MILAAQFDAIGQFEVEVSGEVEPRDNCDDYVGATRMLSVMRINCVMELRS